MKLSKLIKFRTLRVEKRSKLNVITNILWCGAAICLIMAAVCLFISGPDYKSNVREGETSVDFTEYLTIHVFNTPLYILPSDDDMITVKYVCDTDVDIYEDSGRLYIEQADSFVISLFAKKQLDYRIEVYLPQKSCRSINLITNNASVYSCPLKSYMLNIKSKDGYVNIEDISCDGTLTMDFESADADIAVSHFSGGSLDSGSGTVNLNFSEEIGVNALADTRCYLNGLAYMDTSDKNPLLNVAAAGRVRIKTG